MKKAFDYLDNKGISYRFVDVKKEPLTHQEIARLAYFVGIDTLTNRRGQTWRKLNLPDKEFSEEELITILQEHQTAIKRPIIEQDGAILVGYDEDAYEHFFSEDESEVE